VDGHEHAVDHLGQPLVGVTAGPHQCGDPVEVPAEQLVRELLLAGEVVGDQASGDAGTGGDLGDGGVVEALLREDLEGRGEDPLPRLLPEVLVELGRAW
jgi:hypothetical protein